MISGLLLIALGYRPLGRLFSLAIPTSIQYGSAIGIGLITALAGAVDINLVEAGNGSLLKGGVLTPGKLFQGGC